MFVNSTGNVPEARKQAQANATRSGKPWVIFTDTSSNVCVEPQATGPKEGIIEVVQPKPSNRRQMTFAGVTFTAYGRGGDFSEYLTVPKPAFVKIIKAGNVKVVCTYNHSDEAAYQHPTGEVEAATLLPELEDDYVRLITYNVKKNDISFSPHGGKGYTITVI